VDRNDNLWIGTDGGGLDRLTEGQLTSFTTKNGLTNDYVWAIREDHEGSLWIGTNGGGLNSLKNGSVLSLTTREGLPSDFIWSVIRAHDGSLWVGTDDAGVARIRNGNVTTYAARDGLITNAKILLEQPDGSILIAGNNGIQKWQNGRIVAGPVSHSDLGRVTALLEDPDGGLWIATAANGLKHWKNGILEEFTKKDGLSSNSLTSLLRARDDSLWIGTMSGLDRLSSGHFTSIRQTDKFSTDYVTSIFQAPDNTIWATSRNGIFRIRNDHAQAVNTSEGLYDDAIMSTILSNDGSVWMGGNRGLHFTPLRDLENVIDKRRQKVRSKALGLDDGMRSVEINGASSSAWKDPDGRLFFATRGGLATVLPSQIVKNSVAPPVIIEEVTADGQTLRQPPWQLPAGTRRIEIRFNALSFVSPSSVQIKHRLEGFDPDWIDTHERTAGYTNLPAGNYVFHVIASNNDGVWNQEGARVSFTIAPYFYETLWFRTIVISLFVFAGPLFYLIRVRRLRHQKEELRRLVQERTTEVQAANARLANLAREDALTGVANRRRLDEALDEEWRRAYRISMSLAFLLIDVDFFKDYNDHFGHVAGDACLKKIARAVADAHTRAGELVARYGGEEFGVLIPGITQQKAESLAERLRESIERLSIPHPKSSVAPVITISIGVGWIEPSADATVAVLVAAADRALYHAKNSGRNRIATDHPLPT
jgi:diguanylate cyclase (GGDEF)-like protein